MNINERIAILRELDLGNGVAQAEDWARNARKVKRERDVSTVGAPREFVPTREFELVESGRRDLVLGPKGSGKSAIALRLQQPDTLTRLADRGVLVIQAENASGESAFTDAFNEKKPTEPLLRRAWQIYLVELIARTLRRNGIKNKAQKALNDYLLRAKEFHKFDPQTLGEHFNVALRWAKHVPSKIKGKVPMDEEPSLTIAFDSTPMREEHEKIVSINTLLDLADEALCRAGKELWIVFDRLDSVFSDAPHMEVNALRALLRIGQDFHARDGLRLVLFLRDDIKDRITHGGFTELDHAFAMAVDLKWNEEDLIDLIARRLAECEPLMEAYGPGARKQLATSEGRRVFVGRVLPESIGETDTLEWLFQNLRDGSRYPNHPRDLVNFFTYATEEQLHRSANLRLESQKGSDDLFAPTAVIEGVRATSRARLDYNLRAEYPHLRERIDALAGAESQLTESMLGQRWNVGEHDARVIILDLLTVGLLERSAKGYSVAPVYAPALGIGDLSSM